MRVRSLDGRQPVLDEPPENRGDHVPSVPDDGRGRWRGAAHGPPADTAVRTAYRRPAVAVAAGLRFAGRAGRRVRP